MPLLQTDFSLHRRQDGWTGHIIQRSGGLQKRDQMARNATLAGIAFLVLIAGLFAVFMICRSRRYRKNNDNRQKRGWFGSSRGAYEEANGLSDMNGSTSGGRNRRSVRFVPSTNSAAAGSNNNAAGVDRNTSVRSVMTLPVYRQTAGDTEQVIGREGERDGVDVVVDLPTAEDDEQMRENEMQALYELRQARRQQITEREERRRERRDARARNDTAALRDIQARTRAASNSNDISERRREHERIKNERQRAVSSVSYGDLGVARHDGTRIRANSTESERVGLLSDAASIAATSTRSSFHQRAASQASILSADSDVPSPVYTRSRSVSRTRSPRIDTAASSPDPNRADDAPIYSPPGYDDVELNDRSGATTPHINEPPPEYDGPSQQRANRLSAAMTSVATAERRGSQQGDSDRDSPRSTSGAPQLPEIAVSPTLPRIVVEPSSAAP